MKALSFALPTIERLKVDYSIVLGRILARVTPMTVTKNPRQLLKPTEA